MNEPINSRGPISSPGFIPLLLPGSGLAICVPPLAAAAYLPMKLKIVFNLTAE